MGGARKSPCISWFISYCIINSSNISSTSVEACGMNCRATTDSGVRSTSEPLIILLRRLFLLVCFALEDSWLALKCEEDISGSFDSFDATYTGGLYAHFCGTPRCVQSLHGSRRLHFCFLLWHSVQESRSRFRFEARPPPLADCFGWLSI